MQFPNLTDFLTRALGIERPVSLFFKLKLAELRGDMEIWLRRMRRPPCGIKAIGFCALDSEQIQSPDFAGIEGWRQAIQRDCQFRSPEASVGINRYMAFEVPKEMRFPAGRNIEIQPISIRANFEFPIMPGSFVAGLDEQLGHIPQPELIPPAGAAFININFPIAAVEAYKKMYLRPEQSSLGFALRIFMHALPIRAKGNWLSPLPIGGTGEYSVRKGYIFSYHAIHAGPRIN
jgi:hypothetical protein